MSEMAHSSAATPIIGRSSPASSCNADRATTPSPLLRNSQSIGRSTPQLPPNYLSSLSEGIVYDGNNNSSNRRRGGREQTSSKKFKRKRVTYDFEEIDRRSSSTFDPDQLGRPDGPKINIRVNKAVGDVDDDDDSEEGVIRKKTTIVSATDNHVSTNIVFNDERRTGVDATDVAAHGSRKTPSQPRSVAVSNVSHAHC